MRARRLAPGTAEDSAPCEAPFALTEAGATGLRTAAVNRAAHALGVTADMRLTDARAICPHLAAEPIDRDADRTRLAALAAWHRRYSPSVAADGDDGVMLDIAGCAHLFGGEAALAAEMIRRLGSAGLTGRLGFADTQGAAWALARFASGDRANAPVGETRAALVDLPLAALRLAAETVTLLRRFGLTRVGQLYDLDRRALARRFTSKTAAEAVVLRLDQALGACDEPFTPSRPPPRYRVVSPCAEPILHPEGVAAALHDLAPKLRDVLTRDDCGGRRFRFTAFRTDGTSSAVGIATAQPTRDPAHLTRLFAHRLERLDPGFGVDLFVLEAGRTGPMTIRAPCLTAAWADAQGDDAAVAALADRIAARLGDGAVRRLVPRASHIPEQAEATTSWAAAGRDWAASANGQAGPRPVRVFEAPEPIHVIAEIPDGPPARFTWRRVTRRVARAAGPERIAGEWWRAPEAQEPPTRDYYVVEDEDGRRYWLRRDGFYGDPAASPRWFLQGLFP